PTSVFASAPRSVLGADAPRRHCSPRFELCLAHAARAGPASDDRETHLPRASARVHVLSYGDAHGRSTALQQPKLLLNTGLTFMDVSANNVEWVTPSCPMPSEGMRSP